MLALDFRWITVRANADVPHIHLSNLRPRSATGLGVGWELRGGSGVRAATHDLNPLLTGFPKGPKILLQYSSGPAVDSSRGRSTSRQPRGRARLADPESLRNNWASWPIGRRICLLRFASSTAKRSMGQARECTRYISNNRSCVPSRQVGLRGKVSELRVQWSKCPSQH